MKRRVRNVIVLVLLLTLAVVAQQAGSNSVAGTIQVAPPPLIQFSGLAADEGGSSLSGVVSLTFSLYIGQHGGEPLWTETQNNVQLDSTGHYSVQLGITKRSGVPTTLFTTGEARWLGVRIAEQAEQPRVLLLSVPYALKAGDATTIGGLPASAFVLAAPQNAAASPSVTESASGQSVPPPSGAVTGTGTVNFVPLWDTTSDIISSAIFQSGTGSTAKIGINTATPASTLDVKGASTIRGTLGLPSAGTATATKGANSQPLVLVTSAFNSSTSKAVTQTFQWQAEPVENDTSTPSGTFNLLFGSGTTKPAETGFNIASNGQINFAPGQIFPGTGTITGVTTASGSGLTGGGTSGTLNLGLTNACATNQVLQWNGSGWVCASVGGGGGTITGVTAGTALTGGGSSGNVTLNLDTTQVPLLAAPNNFLVSQAITGNLLLPSTNNTATQGVIEIGGTPFIHNYGPSNSNNAFFGSNAGNVGITGAGLTATGSRALLTNTTGSNNTANGTNALLANTTGGQNTANGWGTLDSNNTGGGNTASGYGALESNTGGNNNTANGMLALATNTTGNNNTGVGISALSTTSTGSSNTAIGNNAGATLDASPMTTSNNTFLGANAKASIGSLTNATAVGAQSEVTASNAMVLGSINGTNGATANTNVGIGTTAPAYTLDVHGTGNFTGLVNFAAGQTFPGTGTVTSVASGPGLTGGPITGSGTLGVATGGVTNAMLTNSAVTVSPGTGLTGGGAVALGGSTTLNIDTAKVPLLSAATNIFSGNQTVGGNVTASGVVTGASFQIGSNLFGFGSSGAEDSYVGFAGGSTPSGFGNSASGFQALASNTTGSYNTATGLLALYSNTGGANGSGAENTATGFDALYSNTLGSSNTATGTAALYNNIGDTSGNGSFNTASGFNALASNTNGSLNSAFGASAGQTSNLAMTTGSDNTFVGASTGPGTQTALNGATGIGYGALAEANNATAIGSNAEVTAANALVLGSIAGVNGATASTNVGIGTTAPAYTLDVHGTGNFTGLVNFGAGQTFPGTGSVTSVASGPGLAGGPITGSGTLFIAPNGVTNAMLLNSSVTVMAGTGLTGGGPVALGGSAQLNVDTTAIPTLAGNNNFTGAQNVLESTFGDAVLAYQTAFSGPSAGVVGESNSTSGYGVVGNALAGTGVTIGVWGQTASASGYGVMGTAPTGGVGVYSYGSIKSTGPIIGPSGASTPLAYASISGTGSVQSSTSNLTCSYTGGVYQITISGVTYSRLNYTAVATISGFGGTPYFINTDSDGSGHLIVAIRDASGGTHQADFGVVVFQAH